jgi:DNA polymerase elongation subunit (family B)
MYRCVNYNPFSESIYLRTWTEDGDRIDTEIPYKPYLYMEKEGADDATSIFKTSLVKKLFKNSLERKKFVDNSSNKRIFHNVGVEQQFLIDTYKDVNNDPNFSKFDLKTFFIDIEIEMEKGGAFPSPEKAREPINLITVYDTLNKSTHTWGLRQSYTSTLPDCIYHRCKDEEDLILQFVDYWKIDYPDIVSGWNSAGFDLPYIINRCKNLFGGDFINQFSPVSRVHSRKIYTADFGKEQIKWIISGVNCIDYMEIYKTFSIGERESYSLNYISETELGEGKIAFNAASLGELAMNDWKTFVDYNIQDVHLLVKLEDKLKYLQIVRLLAYKGCTNLEAALGKIAIVTGAVAIQAYKQGFVIPTFGVNSDRESYEGGYVKEPERGLQTAVVSFDVNSLYPNTIITLNISPETKIGKVVTGDFDTSEEVTIRLINGKLHTTKVESFKKFLVQEKMSMSKAGVLYSQKAKGVIPNLIDEIYKERVNIQKQLHTMEVAGKKDAESQAKITYFDTLQYTLKILLNSIYGTFANKHSSLMDIDNAMSITMTGQNVAKAGSAIIDNYLEKEHGIKGKSITIYQDTDSVYVTIQPLLDKLGLSLLIDGEINPKVNELVDKIDKHVNTEILNWAKSDLFSIDPRFAFKREVIADVGVFLQKKRYILHVLNNKGIKVDKFKFVGVELVRSTTPKKVKKFIEKITKTALLTRSAKVANEVYRESYDGFCKLEPDDIALRTSINNLEKYAEGASLYKFKDATPSHVKGAIAYNILIKQLGLSDKLEQIFTSQKVKKIYCIKNKYGLDAISYPVNLPSEFELKVDWNRMFSKLVTQPIERLYEAIGWTLPCIGKEIQTDLFEMFGE